MSIIHTGQWDRLHTVIKWLGLTTHSFAYEVGLNRSENLYRIKNNKNGISRKLVSQIILKYPEINGVWLMAGSGPMLRNDKYGDMIDIPYYSGGINQYLMSPENFDTRFTVPCICDADLAIDSGRTIEKVLPNESIVFLKFIEDKKAVYGKVYYVVMRLYSKFCYIGESKNKNEVIVRNSLESDDNSVEIAIDDIISIFLVVGFFKKI